MVEHMGIHLSLEEEGVLQSMSWLGGSLWPGRCVVVLGSVVRGLKSASDSFPTRASLRSNPFIQTIEEKEIQKPSHFRTHPREAKVAEQNSLYEGHIYSRREGSNRPPNCGESPSSAPNSKHIVNPIPGAKIFYLCGWDLTQPTLWF